MKWVLLYIAVGTTPAQLGNYTSLEACTDAQRKIYLQQMVGPAYKPTPEMKATLDKAIELQIKYDNRYKCIKQD